MDASIGEIIQFIFNNGLAVVLIFYYMKNNNQTMKDLVKSNTELTSAILKIAESQKEIYKIVDNCDKGAV